MNYLAFYSQLFRPLEAAIGPLDAETLLAIIGFDAGGPLNFSAQGYKTNKDFVTYISCELAVRNEQVPSSHGRFELMCHSNDLAWVRAALTQIGHLSLEAEIDDGHTVDLSRVLDGNTTLCGALLERYITAEVDSQPYCILRVHGITSEEMQLAIDEGSTALLNLLKRTGVYPNTDIRRKNLA